MKLRDTIKVKDIENNYQLKLIKILQEEQKRTGLGFIQYNRIIELFKDVK